MRKTSNQIPPSFTKTIQCIRTNAGSVVTLDAKINGSRPMNVFWVKNGNRLKEDNKHRIVEHEDQFTLVVLEVTIEDSGSYECVAMNSVGEARCTANIIVEEVVIEQKIVEKTEAKVIEKMKDIAVREGQSAVFKCRISGNEGI